MRLWSLNASYLDTKGLLAVWREGLLALHVLSGKTKGYTHHPQLRRFQKHANPIEAIAFYLHQIADEADVRGYNFNRLKLPTRKEVEKIPVTVGQLEYERQHLSKKLEVRDPSRLAKLASNTELISHPLFTVCEGPIAEWEVIL